MPVHDVRIESDAEWCTIEIRSGAMWARAPGRGIRFDGSSNGDDSGSTSVEVGDRVVTMRQPPGGRRWQRLVLQVATLEDRVAIHAEAGAVGTVRLATAATQRSTDGVSPVDIMLFVDSTAAALAGAPSGDPTLR